MTASQLRWCKENPDKLKAASKRYREKHRKELRSRQQKHPLRLWLIKQKSKPCSDCNNIFNWWQMQFDHRKPEDKKFGISQMIARHFPIQEIEDEILKCDLVCANCHANRTYKLFSEGYLQRG